ncbi:MAG TPA: hypothetical protein VLF17_07555 [Candidatus Nitrosotenuis sp.]|nr:hypothetical protein [Candidatus Nitrosotenuis sp.]
MKLVLFLSLLAASLLLPNLAFATSGTSQVTVNDSTFNVNYDATGLDVTEITADVPSSAVTVFVTTSDVSGTLAVTLDRSFFDSQTNGEDDDFLVLADGIETTFQESKDAASRHLTIDVPSGTNSIDIIALGSASFGLGQPAEQPPVATPPAEVPEEPAPPAETPAETPAELTCGPGTVLKDGACVLDETCGPGTILQDGTCVLDQTPAPQAAPSRGLAFELIAPIVAAFVIAFIIMLILWAIGRAGRSKN